MGKTKKAEPDFKLWNLRPGKPHHMGGKIKKIRLHTCRTPTVAAEGVKQAFFFNTLSCPEAYRGDGCWQKWPLDGAIYLLAKI